MLTMVAILGGLALIDSTSIGTLFIPLWLLLSPGNLRAGRVLLYLAGIALVYFALGLALLAGATAAIAALGNGFADGGWLDVPGINALILLTGLALVVLSFRKPKATQGPSRLTRWRDRTLASTSAGGLVSLAAASAVLEVLTLFPYLGATAYLASLEIGIPARMGWLGFYCLVMIAPALIMLLCRLLMRNRADKALRWINTQIDRAGGESVPWMLGVFGLLLAGFGGSRLFGF